MWQWQGLTTRRSYLQVTMMAKKIKPVLKYENAIKIEDLPPPGKATGAIVGGLDICLAVDEKGLVYALGNKAPPTGMPLRDGSVKGGVIKEAQFGTSFDLESGEVSGKWCPGGLGFLIGKLFEPVSARASCCHIPPRIDSFCCCGDQTGVPVYKVKKAGGYIQVEVDVNYKLAYESSYWKGILDAQGKTDGGYY